MITLPCSLIWKDAITKRLELQVHLKTADKTFTCMDPGRSEVIATTFILSTDCKWKRMWVATHKDQIFSLT